MYATVPMMVPASVLEHRVYVHALRHREHVRFFHFGQLGQAEIQNLDLALLIDDDVGRFQIAMHDAGVVRRSQSVGHLHRVTQRVVQPHALASDQPIQRFAGHVLHGDEVHRLAVHLAGIDVEDGDDVPVAQRRSRFCFLRKARPPVGIGDSRGWKHFDRDESIQVRVQCAVDHAHSTCAQLGFNSIMPESLADHCRISRSERPSYHPGVLERSASHLFRRSCGVYHWIRMHRRHFLASLCASAVPAQLLGQAPPAKADFTLRIAPASIEIAPHKMIKTLAYNGSVPGPLLRMKEGQPVTIDVFNDTGDPEIVHWHGLRIPSAVDGSMEEGTPMLPAHKSARYSFTPAPSGTRWYHTHVKAGRDLKRGTYTGQFGFLYIDPRSEPGNYDQEIFLALKEWEPLHVERQAPMTTRWMSRTDLCSINDRALGHGDPIRVKQGQRVLLRILNASATVTRRIALAGHQFRVIAMDGNPVAVPREVQTLELGPAERIDAMVEMNNSGVWILGATDDRDREHGLGIVIEYAGQSGEPRWLVPARSALGLHGIWKRRQTGRRGRRSAFPLVFEKKFAGHHWVDKWTINGKSFPKTDPIRVKANGRYRLVFDNRSDEAHPVHLHRHTFELVKIAGVATSGVFKDVVVVGAKSQTEVDLIANNPGLTLFHCHQQMHMDYGFMALMEYV